MLYIFVRCRWGYCITRFICKINSGICRYPNISILPCMHLCNFSFDCSFNAIWQWIIIISTLSWGLEYIDCIFCKKGCLGYIELGERERDVKWIILLKTIINDNDWQCHLKMNIRKNLFASKFILFTYILWFIKKGLKN